MSQGLNVSPGIFDIKTSKDIRNTEGVYKNADDVLGGGQKLEQLDERMRKVFMVCRERGIKLNPSKLQCSRRVKWGGMLVEAVGPVGDGLENTVLISPDQQKINDFLEIETPSTKKECQMIAGCAAQLKRFCLGRQLQYPGIMHLCSANVRFQWNYELQKELEDLKTYLRNHIKLSMIDI